MAAHALITLEKQFEMAWKDSCIGLTRYRTLHYVQFLPVWRTTPIRIMQQEHTSDYLCELAALRLHKLKPQYPLRLRTKKAYDSNKPTCLEELAQRCLTNTQILKPSSRLVFIGRTSFWWGL